MLLLNSDGIGDGVFATQPQQNTTTRMKESHDQTLVGYRRQQQEQLVE